MLHWPRSCAQNLIWIPSVSEPVVSVWLWDGWVSRIQAGGLPDHSLQMGELVVGKRSLPIPLKEMQVNILDSV